MSECTSYRPMIGAREGELSSAEAAALASHLAGCRGCGAWAAELAATEGLVSEALLAAAARRDFAPFVDGVMARIEAARPVPLPARVWRALRLHPWLAAGGALAPVAAVLAFALYLDLGQGPDLVASRGLELSAEGNAVTIIQSAEGPVVLLDDDADQAT